MGLLDLFRPKWKHSHYWLREDAVKELTDQSILKEIAENDKNSDVRKAAVEKLTDKTILAEIAKNDKDWNVRLAAEKKLKFPQAKIDKNDKDWNVRRNAVWIFEDQEILIDIATNDEHWAVRKAAVEKISSITTLNRIESNDSDETVRLAAKNRVFNLSTSAKTEKENAHETYAIYEGESIYVFALINEVGGRGESFAQQICDCVYGQGRCRAGMWKFAGVNEISVNHALRLKNQLGIRWGEPENTWEGVLPSGEKVAALFWKT